MMTSIKLICGMFQLFTAWTYRINYRSQDLLYHHNSFPAGRGLKQISSVQWKSFYAPEYQRVVDSLN